MIIENGEIKAATRAELVIMWLDDPMIQKVMGCNEFIYRMQLEGVVVYEQVY